MLASSLLRRSGLTIIQAEADALPLADESVNCVVTSPPYWNLRSYNAGKGEIGLEKTPQEYVERMVAVFREVRRVLRNDGNVWLNLGDCYTGNRSYQVPDSKHINVGNSRGMKASEIGLKPKDLVGIPWRVAFALQADGWYLRTDIVYSKPNPMPESVADRPTRSHEFVFLLTKNEKYFYDASAIREPHSSATFKRINQSTFDSQKGGPKDYRYGTNPNRSSRGALERLAARVKTEGTPHLSGRRQAPEPGEANAFHPEGRNKRTVWTIPTAPYPDAHFAVMPMALAEPCIKAGCPKGGVVLDPFAGTGTTGIVAVRFGRRAILCDLSMEYLGKQAMKRTKNVQVELLP